MYKEMWIKEEFQRTNLSIVREGTLLRNQ